MKPDAAFDETEETFFRGTDGLEGANSLRPVTLEGEADHADAAIDDLRADRRARFLPPVAMGVTALAVVSALVFASAWFHRSPIDEVTATAGALPPSSTALAEPASGTRPRQSVAPCEDEAVGPLASLVEESVLDEPPAKPTPAKQAPASVPVNDVTAPGKRSRSAPGKVTRHALLAAIRSDLPPRAPPVRTKR